MAVTIIIPTALRQYAGNNSRVSMSTGGDGRPGAAGAHDRAPRASASSCTTTRASCARSSISIVGDEDIRYFKVWTRRSMARRSALFRRSPEAK